MKALALLVALALSGCATAAEHARATAIVNASVTTACTTALVVCQQVKEPDRSSCLAVAKPTCAVLPSLLKLWMEVAKPVE